MKLFCYRTDDSLKELANLCSKILKSGKTSLIRVSSLDDASRISEGLWRAGPFLPHGIDGSDFDTIQPILISTANKHRDVFINFESVFVKHSELTFELDSFVLWNCEPYSKEFKTYQQDERKMWMKI